MRLFIGAGLLLIAVSGADAADTAAAAVQLVRYTNDFRVGDGLNSVAVSPALQSAAERFARYMAKTGRYGHNADGRTPAERAAEQGYEYCIVSENIAYVYLPAGYDSAAALAEAFVAGWQNSAEHRKNMLDANVTQTGTGVAQDEAGRYFATQLFGRPKDAAIRFSVRNQSVESIEYHTGEHSFSLASGATRTHLLCRATEIRFSSEPRSFTARDGMRYTVHENGMIEAR